MARAKKLYFFQGALTQNCVELWSTCLHVRASQEVLHTAIHDRRLGFTLMRFLKISHLYDFLCCVRIRLACILPYELLNIPKGDQLPRVPFSILVRVPQLHAHLDNLNTLSEISNSLSLQHTFRFQ